MSANADALLMAGRTLLMYIAAYIQYFYNRVLPFIIFSQGLLTMSESIIITPPNDNSIIWHTSHLDMRTQGQP